MNWLIFLGCVATYLALGIIFCCGTGGFFKWLNTRLPPDTPDYKKWHTPDDADIYFMMCLWPFLLVFGIMVIVLSIIIKPFIWFYKTYCPWIKEK